MSELISITQTGPHLIVAMLRVKSIYDQKLIVVSSNSLQIFGILQSRVHEIWARLFSGTMKDDLSYAPTDCFAPFPFPSESPLLSDVAYDYESMRAEYLLDFEIGLTEAYNKFHNQYVSCERLGLLRSGHDILDRAVLRAYGWEDLATAAAPEFLTEENESDHRYQGRLFWPAPFRDEVLARLLDLNATRAAAERAHGLIPTAVDEMEDA